MPGFLLDKELGEGRDPMPSTGPGTEAHSLSVCLSDEGMKVQQEEMILPEGWLRNQRTQGC